jgi:Flp pilus assembly protein TadG
MALVRVGHRTRHRREGAAAVELAVLAPFLVFLMLIATDFARIFYTCVILDNCARNGAVYESDPYYRAECPYKSTAEAALADGVNLDKTNPATVTSGTGVDSMGKPYVEVTVKQKFKTVSKFPGIPNDVDLSRTVRMAPVPLNPK